MDTQRRLGDLEVAFNRIITLDAGSHRVASASPPEEAAQRQSVDDEDGGVPIEEPVQDAWEKPVLVHDVALRKDTKDVVDGTNFKVGEPVDERLALCPWHNVQSYPNCFVGKANKTDVAHEFSRIFENRAWDFFYFRDPAKVDERPYLFVPTAQFEDYLDDINARLDIRLSLPNRANLERFILRFDRGMPRPRYWKRAVETEDIRPDGPWPGVYAADIDVFNSATLPARDELVRKLRYARTSPFIEEKRRKAKERSEQKRVERGRMLHQTQVLFGLRGKDGEEQEKVWDANGSKAIERPVFVCFDIEAFERPPNPVSEVGIAVFDSQLVSEVPHGTCGRDWWPVIKAYHLRIREYSGLVNRVFVKGCPGDFNFGKSTFPTRRKLSDAINKILRPYVKACRDIVLVGHDINQDIQYLESIGIAILEVKGMSLVIDSQSTHQAWKKSSNGRSLSAVLADLAIESKNLHNAGNDAVFTMRALIGVTIEDIRQKKVEEGGGTYEPPF